MLYDKQIINELLSEHLFTDQQLKHAYNVALDGSGLQTSFSNTVNSNAQYFEVPLQIDYFIPENNSIVLQWILQQPGYKSFTVNRYNDFITATITSYSNVQVSATVWNENKNEQLIYCLLALAMAGVDVRSVVKEGQVI